MKNLINIMDLSVEEIEDLITVADDILVHPEKYRDIIQSVKEKEIYNLGRGAEAAGRYLVRRIEDLEAQAKSN